MSGRRRKRACPEGDVLDLTRDNSSLAVGAVACVDLTHDDEERVVPKRKRKAKVAAADVAGPSSPGNTVSIL